MCGKFFLNYILSQGSAEGNLLKILLERISKFKEVPGLFQTYSNEYAKEQIPEVTASYQTLNSKCRLFSKISCSKKTTIFKLIIF